MGSLVVLLSLLAEGPVIHAEAGGCPEAAAVSQRLAGLLTDAESSEPDRVDLTADGHDLHLRLSRPDGTLVAERRIPRSNRCPELADAVAALVAAWESDPSLAARPPAPALPPPKMEPALVEEVAVEPPEGPVYELGVVPALWMGGGHLSFAGSVRAGVWSRRSPVGATVAFSATFPFDSASPAALRRHAVSAGVMGRLRHRWLFVDALGEGVLGWLVVSEQGSGTRAQFDPGLIIGLRAGSRVARRLELYLSVSAWGAAWSSAHQSAPGAVPHWGLLTGLGGSFLFGT